MQETRDNCQFKKHINHIESLENSSSSLTRHYPQEYSPKINNSYKGRFEKSGSQLLAYSDLSLKPEAKQQHLDTSSLNVRTE